MVEDQTINLQVEKVMMILLAAEEMTHSLEAQEMTPSMEDKDQML